MAKRACEWCGVEYERPPSQLGRFCGKTCAYAARRKERPNGRRMRRAVGHPLASAGHLVVEARAVLYEKIGPGPHRCHWCGTTVVWTRLLHVGEAPDMLVADHLDADPHNDTPENLAPACVGCNATRGIKVRDDEPHRIRANGSRLRGTSRICEACGSDFVAWETRPGRGRFCSRSCARKMQRRKVAS